MYRGALTAKELPLTDAAGDDGGDYHAALRTVRMTLAGTVQAIQASLAVGDSIHLTYRVTIDALCSGDRSFTNQA